LRGRRIGRESLKRRNRRDCPATDFENASPASPVSLVEWESRELVLFGANCLKADDSGKSFLFTLKNPHNVAARRFALKAEEKHRAIRCHSERGPHFGDIGVKDNCNANTDSDTYLGLVYTNDTGLAGGKVFTFSANP
jgi:hypothetical protein